MNRIDMNRAADESPRSRISTPRGHVMRWQRAGAIFTSANPRGEIAPAMPTDFPESASQRERRVT
jgi:hypothetical protein